MTHHLKMESLLSLEPVGIIQLFGREKLFTDIRALLITYFGVEHLKTIEEIIAILREYAVYSSRNERELLRLTEFVKLCAVKGFLDKTDKTDKTATDSPNRAPPVALVEFIKKTPYWGRCALIERIIEEKICFNHAALVQELFLLIGELISSLDGQRV
jgi:hypothetical protein